MLVLDRESQNPDFLLDWGVMMGLCVIRPSELWPKPPPRWHDSGSTSGIRMCNREEALNRKSGVIGLVCKYSKATYIGGLVRARERQQVMCLD